MRKSGELPWLRPDAKSQVTVRYADERPVAVETVVISTQLQGDLPDDEVERQVITQALEATRWNRTAAAKLLGLSRQSLYAKLSRYDITDSQDEG